MDGILIVDKPKGLTSHDIVDLVRKRFKIKKAGHAGTLDPAATGVLVLLLGKSTRLQSQLIVDTKIYEVVLKLGVCTDTHDSEGKIVSESDCSHLKDEDIEKALKQFVGVQEQIPPMYSAVKHKGKKLYELARKGKTVERKPRTIEIYDLTIKDIKLPYVSFTVHSSKGTYIRQLASDIGETLGCGAYMHELRRVKSGKFSIADALSLSELNALDTKKLSESLL